MELRRSDGVKATEVNREHIAILESKVSSLNQQIDVLNNQLRNQSQSSRVARDEGERKSFEISSQLDVFRRQNDELRKIVP